MFGVGTGKLSLPVPPDAPEGVKLLLQICWYVMTRQEF